MRGNKHKHALWLVGMRSPVILFILFAAVAVRTVLGWTDVERMNKIRRCVCPNGCGSLVCFCIWRRRKWRWHGCRCFIISNHACLAGLLWSRSCRRGADSKFSHERREPSASSGSARHASTRFLTGQTTSCSKHGRLCSYLWSSVWSGRRSQKSSPSVCPGSQRETSGPGVSSQHGPAPYIEPRCHWNTAHVMVTASPQHEDFTSLPTLNAYVMNLTPLIDTRWALDSRFQHAEDDASKKLPPQ